uniref:Uncharacterized protein n=1 Tax=viral metagenome TaxID=1070528 RepID=A0A6C0KIJ9_9ZZZZ
MDNKNYFIGKNRHYAVIHINILQYKENRKVCIIYYHSIL